MPRKSNSRGRPSSPPSPVPVTYPGKRDDGTGLDEPLWTACRDMLDTVYKAKNGSRRMADIFHELPDADEYADYYEAIPEPECLDNICTRLREKTFIHPEDFFKQLHLVFLNAMHYNEEGSQVWNDAKDYENMILEMWRTRGANGPFSSIDPYHKGRKQVKAALGRSPAATTSSPNTPAVAKQELPTAATPPVTIHLRVPRPGSVTASTPAVPAPSTPPVAAAMPSSAAPMSADSSRSRETRGVRAAAAAATAKMTSPVKAAQQLPAQPQQATLPTGWQHLNPTDNALVAATDASMALWEGPKKTLPGDPAPGGHPGSGWWGEGSPDYERSVGGVASHKHRIQAVAEAINGYKDPSGNTLSAVFALVPPSVEVPYLSTPSSSVPEWSHILFSARNGRYPTLLDFELDMAKLFEKTRRFVQRSPIEYGRALTLQRLYNALTAPFPLKLDQGQVPRPSATQFASIPCGPGNPRTMTVQAAHDAVRAGAPQETLNLGVTTLRIPTKDRHFTEEARLKGVSYRTGDWVHLINPDDASKPIVGQIFKSFIPTSGYPTHHVTVAWYFRPEQTVHMAEQTFFENEVFKSAYFCDHPIEDVIEKITVQPWESAQRGRPGPAVYHPGDPLYVVRSRYIDKAHFFMAVKRWDRIIPEGVSLQNFINVVPYKRLIQLPIVKSPFTLGVKGPGGVGRPKRQAQPDDDESMDLPIAYGRAAQARAPEQRPPMPTTRSSYGQGPSPQTTTQRLPHQMPAGPSRTPSAQQLPTQSQAQSPAPQAPAGRNPQRQWQQTPRPQAPLYPSRTIASVTGGAQVLEQVAVREYLPPETARLFEQDARHQVLWFSGPPLPQGAVQLPAPPHHSLEYLTFLSRRKRGASAAAARPVGSKRYKADGGREGEDGDVKMEENGEDEDEDLAKEWWTQGQSAEQVLDSLKAVVDGAA